MEIEIIWPERDPDTRVIPLAAESMVFTVVAQEFPWTGRTLIGKTNRPASGRSVLRLEQLPECKLKVDVAAHPRADGAGAPLGVASQMVPLSVKTPRVTVNFKMTSTVDRIEIQENRTEIEVLQDIPFPVVPSAYNAEDEALLLFPPPRNWVFKMGNTSIATVDAAGNVKGIKPGSTTLSIEAVEPDGNGVMLVVKQRTFTLRVTGGQMAVLGRPKPNANGSQDPPGLYWQSLTSGARSLLVRTTGEHRDVQINPENTRMLFTGKVVHADRTDTDWTVYVVNFDGTGLRPILQDAIRWPTFKRACYMAAGNIAVIGSPDAGNSRRGVYLCNDDGSNLRLAQQMDGVDWMEPTPSGEEVFIFGTRDWKIGPESFRFNTFWLLDDVQFYGPVHSSYQSFPFESGKSSVPLVSNWIWNPIVLSDEHWIASSEPILEGGLKPVRGHRAFWEFKMVQQGTNKYQDISLVCETSEVRGTSPLFNVSRDGRTLSLMFMQSQRLRMPNPDTVYLYDLASRAATPTAVATHWNWIASFALANLKR